MSKVPDSYVKALLAEKQRRDATRKAPSPPVATPKPRVDRVQQAREAITRGVDYVGNFLLQGRAPELGGAVRQMVEPIAQFPVTMVTDPLRAANQAQQALDPAYALARGLTTTRMGVQARNPAEIASGVTEMGFAGLSAIPGGAAVKSAKAMSRSRNVLAEAEKTATQPRNVLATPPKPVQEAQTAGYQGADIGEAKEWVSARKKGLDMSQPARLQRAQTMGFNTNTPFYHGSANENIQAFKSNQSETGEGIFLTDNPFVAEEYSNVRDLMSLDELPVGATNQQGFYDLYVRGKFKPIDVKGAHFSQVNMRKEIAAAKAEGFDGIDFQNINDAKYSKSMSGTTRVVFDPRNIRSVNAAFDPEETGSANILAGLGTGAAGVTAASMAGEEAQAQEYGARPDGAPKGQGFLGPLTIQLPDGSTAVATEYSVGVNINGKEMDIPTLVPTLTPAQRKRMLEDIIPNDKPPPRDIVEAAVKHARKRLAEGKSVFAD